MTTAAFKAELNKAQRIINTLKRMCDGSAVVRTHTVVSPEIEKSRDAIVSLAAAEFGVDPERVVGESRTLAISTARHVAIHLLQLKHGLTTVVTGDLFNRDHSSVSHANNAVKARMETEPAFKARVEKLKGLMK